MPKSSELHQRILARFREVFGEPDNTLGRDDHWALKPDPHKLAINVLANGTAELPAIWVFDPHDHNDGVLRIGVKSHQDIEDFITLIRDRLERARLITYQADGVDGAPRANHVGGGGATHRSDGHPLTPIRRNPTTDS